MRSAFSRKKTNKKIVLGVCAMDKKARSAVSIYHFNSWIYVLYLADVRNSWVTARRFV